MRFSSFDPQRIGQLKHIPPDWQHTVGDGAWPASQVCTCTMVKMWRGKLVMLRVKWFLVKEGKGENAFASQDVWRLQRPNIRSPTAYHWRLLLQRTGHESLMKSQNLKIIVTKSKCRFLSWTFLACLGHPGHLWPRFMNEERHLSANKRVISSNFASSNKNLIIAICSSTDNNNM